MDAYLNKSGRSGVIEYEIGLDFIKVKFRGSNYIYLYNYQIPGASHVETMKVKAIDGIGLTTYINRYVNGKFYNRI